MKWIACLLMLTLCFSRAANAENPWGPECTSLDDCLSHFRKLPDCELEDEQCFWSLGESNNGLGREFEKLGPVAVPPLLEIVKSSSPTQAARAAEVLWGMQDQMQPDQQEVIREAWRRDVPGMEMLASHFATPEFVKELMALLRKNPIPESREGQTFSNLRDWDEKPSGIHATIVEQIECAGAGRCEPRFAKLQFDWIVSNFRAEQEEQRIPERMMQAIENPRLDIAGKIAALQYFRPSQYGRSEERLRGKAVPFLRLLAKSGENQLRIEAANLLAMFADEDAREALIATASDQASPTSNRVRALTSLAQLPHVSKDRLASIEVLLRDPDWDVRRHAIVLLGVNGDNQTIVKLIKQVDAKDWRASFSAVSALKNSQDRNAKRFLQQVAETYWHPFVRDVALPKQTGEPNLAQYPESEKAAVELGNRAARLNQSPVSEIEDFVISRICKARFQRDGYRFVPDFIVGPEVFKEMVDASAFNRKHFEASLLNLDVMKRAIKSGLVFKYQEWTFSGSALDGGEGQLTVSGPTGQSQTILKKDTYAVFGWNGRPHVAAGGEDSYPRGDAFLFELFQNSDRGWAAKPVLRLTGVPEVWLAPDQSIGILGSDGVMLIHKNGSPEWIGCPQPVFP